jgi:hypothetical protein
MLQEIVNDAHHFLIKNGGLNMACLQPSWTPSIVLWEVMVSSDK